MDVTFVLEESGVTATVEVPCEAKVAAAKEVACTALAVSPVSVEMRIGTQVLEGTCRLQDTAFDAGVQVVLARPRLADIKCPAEKEVDGNVTSLSLSRCGTLCIYHKAMAFRRGSWSNYCVGGFDTDTFETVFSFAVKAWSLLGPPAISQCKTRCYLACNSIFKVALPGGEVLLKIDGISESVFVCGNVVVSQGKDGVSVYDEDLTLLRSLSHEGCIKAAVSDCGGWVVSFSYTDKNARVWDVNTGVHIAVACVPVVQSQTTLAPSQQCEVAVSRSASMFAVGFSQGVYHRGGYRGVRLFDMSGAVLHDVDVEGDYLGMQFTPCGKYLVLMSYVTNSDDEEDGGPVLSQWDVVTMSRVQGTDGYRGLFAISPCSRVALSVREDCFNYICTNHLYPHEAVKKVKKAAPKQCQMKP